MPPIGGFAELISHSLRSSKPAAIKLAGYLAAAATSLAHARTFADCAGLIKQLRGIDAHSGAGRAIVHATHEGQSIAQIALDRKGGGRMVFGSGWLSDRLSAGPAAAEKPMPP